MLKSIKNGIIDSYHANQPISCLQQRDPSITDETPGQNTGNGGNENEVVKRHLPKRVMPFRVLTVQVVIPAEQAEMYI